MTNPETDAPFSEDAYRARQKVRARWTALFLFLFVALVFGITIAKMDITG